MTTQRTPPVETLTRVARALRFAQLAQGTVRWGVVSAGGLLALLAVDQLLRLPQALRLPLAVVLVGYSLFNLYRRVLKLALRPFSASHAARWLEVNRGIGGNVLINAYQFEHGRARAEWEQYTAPVVASSKSILGGIPPRSLWLTAQLKRWALGLLLLVGAWLTVGLAFPHYLAIGMERIFLPLADVPPVGNWYVEISPARPITLVQGDKLDITVKVRSALRLKTKPPVPTLLWQDGAGAFEGSAGQRAPMLPTGKPDEFTFSFSAVTRPFSFAAAAGDSRSATVRVEIQPLPQIKSSAFEVTPPAYTGVKPYLQPGPPSALEVPEGSMVKATVNLADVSPKVQWRDATAKDNPEVMVAANGGWQIARLVNESTSYELMVALTGLGDPRLLAQGQITALPDHPPQVDFVTQDRNRAVTPGASLPLTLAATDDYGVASITLQMASSDDPSGATTLKTWSFVGPPGDKAPAPESYTVELDPAIFTPGSTFLLTAQATDFSPGAHKTTSRPILVRVAGLQEMAVPAGDALEKLFDLLRATIVQQTQANGQTDNLKLHLAEAQQNKDVAQHLGVMTDNQKQAQASGRSAIDEAGQHEEGKPYLAQLQTLVNGEMDLALGQIPPLAKASGDALPKGLAALQQRQVYILNGLISLLGKMAGDRQEAAELRAKKQGDTAATVPKEQELAKLKDELQAFEDKQKRIIDASKMFVQLNPEDLTTDQQAALGELAREEAKEATFFQEKLTDLSKLPLQDFGDGKLVSDMNEVYQEVQKAATDAYQKRFEAAVTAETVGLEKASEIEQNLERWLGNTPDNTRWSMEEPAAAQDIPTAELPKELDDVIGDLLKREQEMDKDDPSSTIMDSIDKGAGWGAGDGPMSNMSAKGVTGNNLPNNNEITGRSGEGRDGKSDGQMVGDTAVGKGGNNLPSRMTPTPFENGSVNDTSKERGSGTGGGKLAGYGEEGLRGAMPPEAKQKMQRMAESQAKLRQQAESLALQLRKQRRPTGDLESAIIAMKNFEAAARSQNGLAVTQGYHRAIDSLQAARSAYAGDRLSRVEANALHRTPGDAVFDTQAEDAPAGYEEMTGAYFRSLSESSSSAPSK